MAPSRELPLEINLVMAFAKHRFPNWGLAGRGRRAPWAAIRNLPKMLRAFSSDLGLLSNWFGCQTKTMIHSSWLMMMGTYWRRANHQMVQELCHLLRERVTNYKIVQGSKYAVEADKILMSLKS
jgi:hypothetical protein